MPVKKTIKKKIKNEENKEIEIEVEEVKESQFDPDLPENKQRWLR